MSSARRLTLVLLLLAFAFRLALAYPTHRTVADADNSLSALCALHVIEGRLPVFFPGGVRLGAPSCYVTAGLFSVFGVSPVTHALGPVLVGWATVLVWFAFYRELFGDRRANLALLFIAIPTSAFTFWTYMPNAYPEVLFACAAVLWAAARVHRGGPTPVRVFAFGMAAGFGVWVSLQTLTCSLPAFGWLALGDRRAWLSPRRWATGLAGALVGGAPWVVYNVIHPLGTFRNNFAARPVNGVGSLWSNLDYLVRYQVPELFASLGTPELSGLPPAVVHRLGPVVLALFVAAAVWAWLGPRSEAEDSIRESDRSAGRLLLAVGLTVAVFDVVSEAATYRGPSVRYIMPLYLLMPGIVTLAAPRVPRRWRPLAAAAAAFVLAYAIAGARLPGTSWRSSRELAERRQAEQVDALRSAGVEAVVGPYWIVYPFNFLGYPDLRAVPFEALADPDAVESRFGASPARWAVFDYSEREVERLLAGAGLEGRPLALSGVAATVIDGRHEAATLVGRVRAARASP